MDDVLVVGEALVDIVVRRTGDGTTSAPVEIPGGSPANVALGLARLGRPTQLVTRLGDDERGRRVRTHLESAGVRLWPGSVVPGPTSTATATVDPAGVASYDFALDWRLPPVAADPLHHAALHTGSIAAFLQPGGDEVLALVEAASGRLTVTYDPNARPVLMGDPVAARARVEHLVALSDVVKVSDEDLAWLAPGEDPLDVARAWLDSGPAVVVVTRGGQGADALNRAGTVHVDPRPIRVADTVGAGDSFMAGLLDHLASVGLLGAGNRPGLRALREADLEAMLRHAAAIADITCSRAGANPPTRAELQAWSPPGAG
ncbi:MAG: carbohydrate kinase [Kineosporiaceae bacterium]